MTTNQNAKFSSADFDKTPPALIPRVPDRLVHRNVLATNRDGYSEERRHPVSIVDLPTRTISMTIGGLAPGGKTNMHRHTYETVLYVLKGRGYSIIEDQKIEWEEGDAVYVPVWAWHQHCNADAQAEATYVACENAPLLQNLGEMALREES
ncbi:cupin domain-containing protein [Arhodomonas sp. AD133]|uniref:cupin domain-containing protein n=1 Tax=Arhodomonas sp. AD133 TaxID=3415009 RepID=UPI003EBA62B6